ncbi:MAG: lamin tail domain-containing protein [Kiritimatiellae bacterium]|nr:lamin tail domain-containing protein [Kiritimatiellia bacterium]
MHTSPSSPSRPVVRLLFAVLFVVLAALPALGDVLVPKAATWRYFKGTAEASDPRSAWREIDFADSAWLKGVAPFGYGVSGLRTTLGDMQNNYTSFFIRRTFTVSSLDSDTRLRVAVNFDDGFIVWINGERVAEKNAPDASPLFNSVASEWGSSEGAYETNSLPDPEGYLEIGENVIAVQAFNQSAASGDCCLDVELSTYKKVNDTTFSHDRGFYTAAFAVTISTDTPGATIRYTTNGSAPSASSGTTGGTNTAVSISKSTCLRAAAFKAGYEPTDVDTQTYIFPAGVLTQTRPSGYTTNCAQGALFTYELDPGLKSTYGSAAILNGMTAIPTLSVVGSYADVFSTAGFIGTTNENESLHPVSIELLYPDEPEGGFQIDCAARRHKSWAGDSARVSFKLEFSSLFGPSKLRYPFFEKAPVNAETGPDRFDRLVVRGGANHSFCTTWISNCYRTVYARDPFVKACQVAASPSGLGPHTTFVNLYLNGLYWGVYDVCERTDHFFSSTYMGGEHEDWFACNHHLDTANWKPPNVINGDPARWYYLRSTLVKKDMSVKANYEELKQYVALTEYCDYLLANWFCGTVDWPGNNWYGSYRMTPEPGPMYFYAWDAECSLREAAFEAIDWPMPFFGPYQAPTTSYYYKSDVAKILRAADDNADFRTLMADRAYRLFFNNGPLTAANARDRWMALCNYMEPAIAAESARWGNYAFPGHPVTTNLWCSTRNAVRDIFTDSYVAEIIQQMRTNSPAVYPSLDPPAFNQHGGVVAAGFKLTLSNPNSAGTVYYTADGSDPRSSGGAIASQAKTYTGALALSKTTHVQARVYKSTATWSALHAATFNFTAHYSRVRITEIMYNPIGGGEFEFIELQNTGTSARGLSEMRFKGIQYTFAPGAELAAGQMIVLARNASAFQQRYGVAPFGEFGGGLDNAGERISLLDCDGRTVCSVRYNDKDPWPETADGEGFSLVAVDPNAELNDAGNWRASNLIGGSPGYDDGEPYRVVINEALTHTDPPQRDAIELHNAGSAAVDIGGWYLSDSAFNYKKYRIPTGTSLPAGGYVVFDETVFNTDSNSPACFALDSHGDEVYLTKFDAAGNLQYLAEQRFGGAANGAAFGRWMRSDGEADFVEQSVANTLGAANAYPRVGPIVINEVMYHPATGGDEYIELLNTSGTAVKLYDPAATANTWELDGAVAYTFASGVEIPAGGYALVVATNASVFRSKYGIGTAVQIFGPYEGRLSNSGESVKLWRPDTPDPDGVPRILVDRVAYNDNSLWPENADGGGCSLERIAAELYGNDPANWASSLASGGTPGRANSGVLAPKTAGWLYRDSGTDLGTAWRAAAFDDNGWKDGNAPLGYGYEAVDTEVAYGENPSAKPITTYFRKHFMLGAAPSALTKLTLLANYDDGFVAYLNGQEVARRQLPGTVTYGTTAAEHGAGSYESIDLLSQKGKLVSGENVLAVELHQSSPSSSDLFLDMELSCTFSATVTPAIQTSVASVSVPEGGTATLQVRLSAQPASSVTVSTTRSSGDTDLTVSGGATRTFTTSNWNTYQTVTLAAAEDNSDNANGTATITCSGNGLTSASLTATEADDDYTLTVTAANGTVTKSPNSTYYDNGSSVQLTATPNAGYTFTGWSGALSGTANPATLTMNADKSVTANFAGAIPAAPTGVTAAPVATDQIDVTWVDNSSDETRFKIRCGTDPANLATEIFVAANATRYSHTGLAPGTTWYYKIRSENAAGVSAYTDPPVSATTLSTAAAAPSDLAADALSASQIRLTWSDNSDNEIGFKLRRGTTPESQPDEIYLPANTTAYVDTGRAPNTTHYYMLKARDTLDGSAYTPLVSARTARAEAAAFAAFNDLAWEAGQTALNISLYTLGQGGLLTDYATGERVSARLTVGDGGGGPYTDQGTKATAGTEADALFGGKVDARGLISYATADLTLSLTGLDPAYRYTLVLFGNRAQASYSGRTTVVVLEGAESFANSSTAGAVIGTTAASGDTTTIANGYNTANGYVARYEQVDPGADGAVTLRMPAWSGTGDAGRYYLNALAVAATPARVPQVLVAKGADWRYMPGTAEASSPAAAWRGAEFSDSAWLSGAAPFGYGPLVYGTRVGMAGKFTSLFLRKPFTLTRPAQVSELRLNVDYDDGFIVWINGQEVARVNVQDGPVAYDEVCSGYVTGSSASWSAGISGGALPVLGATNVLAVQLFNNSLSSGDALFDAELAALEAQVDTLQDMDGDTLPDAWEAAHVPDSSGQSDADGDGVSDYQEYVAGTNPTQGADWFGVNAAMSDGHVAVRFPTVAADGPGYEGLTRHYALERCSGMNAWDWAAVPGYEDIVGTGQTVTYSSADGVACMYRARVWLE